MVKKIFCKRRKTNISRILCILCKYGDGENCFFPFNEDDFIILVRDEKNETFY